MCTLNKDKADHMSYVIYHGHSTLLPLWGLPPLSGQDSEGDLIFGWAQLLPTNQKRITAHNMKMAKIAPTHAYRPMSVIVTAITCES